MSDESAIIERVLSGEAGAYRQFVELYHRIVFQFVRNMLRSPEDAEELTQDVFVAAFQSLATFDSARAKVSTWLLTIARNRCLNRLRQRPPDRNAEIEQPDPAPCPAETASQREVWLHLDAALQRLPLDQRTAFVLAEIQELPHAEVAAIEGIELGTVKSRVSRARERLRAAMRAWQPERVANASPRRQHHE